MKSAIIILIVTLLGTLAANMMMADAGTAIVEFRGQRYDTTVFGLLLLFVTAYFAVRLALYLLRAPRKFGEAVGEQRVKRAKRKMNQGLIEMAEGNWSRGERLLSQGANSSENPLLNYLNAARAAQLQGAHERRDNWLMLAYEQDPDAASAVLLTQAELQIDHGQHEEALATLRKVNESEPGHRQALALLASIYSRLGDWDALRELLPQLRKKKALNPEALTAITRTTYVESIRATGLRGDHAQLEQLWNSLPSALKQQHDVLHAYIGALSDSQQSAAAEKALRKALNTQWHDDLVLDYGVLQSGNNARQLGHVESWLKTHPDDASLLLSAARLSMRQELWGKARSYLEASLAINPRVEAYHLYGELLEKMGESEGAAVAFRNGLTLATGSGSTTQALPKARDRTS